MTAVRKKQKRFSAAGWWLQKNIVQVLINLIKVDSLTLLLAVIISPVLWVT